MLQSQELPLFGERGGLSPLPTRLHKYGQYVLLSRLQTPYVPRGVGQEAVEEAVMDATGASLPEFHVMGDDAEAAPEVREGYFPLREFGPQFLELHHEELPRGNDLALVGDPCAELRFTGPREEIFQRFGT